MSNTLPFIDGAVDGSSKQTGLTRRQLVKAGAWAAPVIVLATAAPAAASSLGTITFLGGSAAFSGAFQRNLTARFTSTYSQAKTLSRISVSSTNPAGATFTNTVSVVVPANATDVSIPLGEIQGVTGFSVVTITYSFSTGGTPSTETVIVAISI